MTLSWRDCLLAVFCFRSSSKWLFFKKPRKGAMCVVEEPNELAADTPWLLPVYVLSKGTDVDSNHFPKQGRCTIDTGNMIGNIVSRTFVEDVLGFSESDFTQITEMEKKATTMTSHQLVTVGAISLTWYHKNHNQVFRGMRFLVSPNQQYDLVIGARSIQKHNLLAVPNLAEEAQPAKVVKKGKPVLEPIEKSAKDEERERLKEQIRLIKMGTAPKRETEDDVDAINLGGPSSQPRREVAIAQSEDQMINPETQQKLDVDTVQMQHQSISEKVDRPTFAPRTVESQAKGPRLRRKSRLRSLCDKT